MRALALLLPILVSHAAPLAATVQLPSHKELVRVAKQKDPVELERVASRFGGARLWRIAERGTSDEHKAALTALGYVDDAWSFAQSLVRISDDPKEPEALLATQTLARIVERWSPLYLEERDVPPDAQRQLADAVLASLLRPPVPVAPTTSERRVALLGVASRLVSLGLLPPSRLAPLIHDSDVEVRLAAVDAMRKKPSLALAELDLVIAGDTENRVAAAAAAAACHDVPAVGNTGSAVERVQKLTAPARDRLRGLAADENVALVDRLDLVACLRVFATPADTALLGQLAQKPPEAMKRRARSLSAATSSPK